MFDGINDLMYKCDKEGVLDPGPSGHSKKHRIRVNHPDLKRRELERMIYEETMAAGVMCTVVNDDGELVAIPLDSASDEVAELDGEYTNTNEKRAETRTPLMRERLRGRWWKRRRGEKIKVVDKYGQRKVEKVNEFFELMAQSVCDKGWATKEEMRSSGFNIR